MWSGKINMLLFYVLYDLWFVTSLLHYFSVPCADTCNIIVSYKSTVTVTKNTVIMFSTVKNNAYSEHVMEIMTQGLRKVCNCHLGKSIILFPMLAIYFRALSVTWSSMFPQARRLLNVTNLYYPGPGKVQVCLSVFSFLKIYISVGFWRTFSPITRSLMNQSV